MMRLKDICVWTTHGDRLCSPSYCIAQGEVGQVTFLVHPSEQSLGQQC